MCMGEGRDGNIERQRGNGKGKKKGLMFAGSVLFSVSL